MDFFVYDNFWTFNKMNKAATEDSQLLIKRIAITNQRAFWFETGMKMEDHNVNINRPYVHLHKGIQSYNRVQFKKDPWFIDTLKDVVYDPKDKKIKIYAPGSFPWPWRKPIFQKNVFGKYYGVDKPDKKIKPLGNWYFNYHNQSIHVILNYFPGYPNFKYQ
ncbi:MAG: hypothetical protein GWN01_01270 [Nitrosopumilaceae archaeon]|nr:hypothetical protein [Nitrosopumilaceae archaeon]NIU85990.1 hypothetical protein [Nitrosopumilaceae archaeon]NIX60209.1 hypothetical protein [Nitrosopumilaceae archaeon]